ncbi:MAG: hypothetical protein A2Z21_10510 [Candidatus Fraserbacteria bacterium RBG_16_55_9]|uniref:Uncharacterized protein n=1 Tax=Fraserbacteria sp. (strain RBG_16_55_9) TaxID=1817864 RepID=A0A1F5UPU5_FRAXR|nr:MAG: hypothetical protein A2Z21_10510 [Candidatus Fraserbacteria bacterium RBG_16_55_9]
MTGFAIGERVRCLNPRCWNDDPAKTQELCDLRGTVIEVDKSLRGYCLVEWDEVPSIFGENYFDLEDSHPSYALVKVSLNG